MKNTNITGECATEAGTVFRKGGGETQFVLQEMPTNFKQLHERKKGNWYKAQCSNGRWGMWRRCANIFKMMSKSYSKWHEKQAKTRPNPSCKHTLTQGHGGHLTLACPAMTFWPSQNEPRCLLAQVGARQKRGRLQKEPISSTRVLFGTPRRTWDWKL